jgi:hypothetical protein
MLDFIRGNFGSNLKKNSCVIEFHQIPEFIRCHVGSSLGGPHQVLHFAKCEIASVAMLVQALEQVAAI